MLLNKRIPLRYILNKVKFDLFYVLIVSVSVLLITDHYQHALPEIPLTIPAFIGTAISILLSFKLNQSYDRWWESRKIWGSIVNDSRSLVVQLQSFVATGNEAIIRKMVLRQMAWCYSLGQSLRRLPPLEGLDTYLSAEDLSTLQAHQNKPLAMLQLHSQDIKDLKSRQQLELLGQVQLDSTLVRLCDAQGKSERIKSTVFPVTYRIFLHFIIYLFVITLSISMQNAGYFEIPLLMLISGAFFLLEKSASHMQDPFENRPTDTAVTGIARTIEINLRQLIGDTHVPQPYPAVQFYQL